MRHLLLLETWESLWDFGGHQQYPFISPIIPKGLRVPKFQPSESCSSYQSNEEILYPYVLTNRHLNQSFHASLILHDCCTIHSGSGEMHLDDLGSLGDQGRVGGRVCGLHWVADCRCFQACVKLLMMLMARWLWDALMVKDSSMIIQELRHTPMRPGVQHVAVVSTRFTPFKFVWVPYALHVMVALEASLQSYIGITAAVFENMMQAEESGVKL